MGEASDQEPAQVSYAQRFEDLYVMRCFGEQAEGFYIDIGAGHPVYDNMSFAFYLKGWSGVTVEPNPWLAQLSRAVRPRDRSHQALVSDAPGEAPYYLVDDFHGLSTMIAAHAASALSEFGKSARSLLLPVTTLKALCEQHAPPAIDFLKVDVEGAEREVLLGADWTQFRPKVVVVEALAPYTLAPAWDSYEPLLFRHGYRHVWFDSLNRYYLAEEAGDLARHFETAPENFDAVLFRDVKPALDEPAHPDHHLATLVGRSVMTRLPVLDRGILLELLTAGIPAAELSRIANAGDIAAVFGRLFGRPPGERETAGLRPSADITVKDLYALLIDSDAFRIACGRISSSYAW